MIVAYHAAPGCRLRDEQRAGPYQFISVPGYHFVHTLRLQLKAHGINDSWNTLRQTLATLWKDPRHKRIYLHQVLAHGEVESSCRPARKLWARTRNGHHLPNPDLQLRKGEGWQPVYQALQFDWVRRGTGTD